jgi:hypothetical protein
MGEKTPWALFASAPIDGYGTRAGAPPAKSVVFAREKQAGFK